MTTSKRGAPLMTEAEHKPHAPDAEPVPRRLQHQTIKTKAPSRAKFELLELLMREYLDDGDEFSGRQAAAILRVMSDMINLDYTL